MNGIVLLSLFLMTDATKLEINAPYQVDRSVKTGPSEIGFDFGTKKPDERHPLPRMTLFGTSGFGMAKFVEFRQSCLHLCAEDTPPTCHWVGIYKPTDNRRLGEILGGLVGETLPENKKLTSMPAEECNSGDNTWLHRDYQQPLTDELSLRWSAVAGEKDSFLESRDLGRNFYAPPIALSACKDVRTGVFVRVECGVAKLLYFGTRLLLSSFADYGDAAADVLGSFRVKDAEYFVVRVGLKAQKVVALLRHSGDKWELLIRPADYPLLC